MNRLLLIALCVLAPQGLLAQSWQLYTTPSKPAVFLITDSALWVGSDGVVQMDPESEEILASFRRQNSGILRNEIAVKGSGPNGSLWLGHPDGISVKSGSRWHSSGINGGANSFVPVTDSSGWVISSSNFLWWFDGSQISDSIGSELAVLGGRTISAALTSDGIFLVATDSGLVQRQGSSMTLLRWKDTPPGRLVPDFRLYATNTGGVWLLAQNGLRSFHFYHPVNGWLSYPVNEYYTHYHFDPTGQIWLSEKFSAFKWELFATKKQRALVMFYDDDQFQVDSKGRVWSASVDPNLAMGSVVRNDQDGGWRIFSPAQNGLWSAFTGSIALDEQDRVYLTYSDHGPLTRFSPDSGIWEQFLFDNRMLPQSLLWGDVAVAPDGIVWTSFWYNDYQFTDIDLEGIYSFDPQANTWKDYPLYSFLSSAGFPYFTLSSSGFLATKTRPVVQFKDGSWSTVPPATGQMFEKVTLPAWDNEDRLLALIGGPETLGTYEPASGWTTISLPETPTNAWRQLLVDRQNTKWLVSNRGILQLYDDFAGNLGYSTRWISPDSLGLERNENLLLAAFDNHDAFWFFTDRHRLVRLHCDGTLAFTIPYNLLPAERWSLSDIEIDSKGKVYLSVYRQGLYVFDPGNLPNDPCPDNTPFLSEEWIAYPNPATDRVTLSLGDPQAGELTFRWFDLSGRMVMEERAEYRHPGNEILIGQLPGGFYFLEIVGADRSWTVKVRKE